MFRSWDVPQRENFIRKYKMCHVCLRSSGHAQYCSKYSCKLCQERHSTLLHQNSAPISNAINGHLSSNINDPSSFTQSSSILPTVIVQIAKADGELVPATALLDSASDCSLISQRLFERLKLRPTSHQTQLRGILSSHATTEQVATLHIKSNTTNWSKNLDAVVVPHISSSQFPKCLIDTSSWNVPPNITLANPNFNVPNTVDLILGVEVCSTIGCSGTLTAPLLPTIQNSMLGWYVFGKYSLQNQNSDHLKMPIKTSTNPIKQCASTASLFFNPP